MPPTPRAAPAVSTGPRLVSWLRVSARVPPTLKGRCGPSNLVVARSDPRLRVALICEWSTDYAVRGRAHIFGGGYRLLRVSRGCG